MTGNGFTSRKIGKMDVCRFGNCTRRHQVLFGLILYLTAARGRCSFNASPSHS